MKNSIRLRSFVVAVLAFATLPLQAAPVLPLNRLQEHLETRIPGDCKVKIEELKQESLSFALSNSKTSVQAVIYSDPQIFDELSSINGTGGRIFHFHNYSKVTGNTATRFRMVTTFAMRKIVSLSLMQLEYRGNEWVTVSSVKCEN